MDNQRIAKELVAVARELTAAMHLEQRIDNAEKFIRAGGRGIELGIREIGLLAEGAAQLYKDMRKIQWDASNPKSSVSQGALLDEIRKVK